MENSYGAFKIYEVASVVLTLNRTYEEATDNKLRLFLEKQPNEIKKKIYNISTNYSMCDFK